LEYRCYSESMLIRHVVSILGMREQKKRVEHFSK
jgi:hypothetical protein